MAFNSQANSPPGKRKANPIRGVTSYIGKITGRSWEEKDWRS